MADTLHFLISDGYSKASRDELQAAGMKLAWELYAEMLLGTDGVAAADRAHARTLLVRAAYMEGDIGKEREHLRAWQESEIDGSLELDLRLAAFAMRQSQPTTAVEHARRALQTAERAREGVEAGTALATAPAATLATVSLADARPPPRQSRIPYLAV